MKAFGEHLVRAREAAGLTLDDIHQRTRISRKNLQLLEAGDFPSIPQTYVRAFVREYARNVGLDEDETLALYNELAERERGVPRPPSAIDSSNLLPRIDDSVEFIPLPDRSSSHVEVDGKAEAIDDNFVQKIRKSSFVPDDSTAAIDIRTTAPPAAEPGQVGVKRSIPAGHDPAETSRESRPRSVSREQTPTPAVTPAAPLPADSPDTVPTPEATVLPSATTKPPPKEAAPPASTAPPKAAAAPAVPTPPKAAAPPPGKPEARPESVKEAASKKQAEPAPDVPPRPRVYDTKPPIDEARRLSESAGEKAQERRIMGIGFVVLAMLAVAVYGIYFFSFRGDSEESAIDSTAIKASIEAGRFIDSTQAALTEIELPPDTLPADTRTPPEAAETKTNVYARDDSLVLEAFTNAPVWFSVKMDTLRTERGSLSSNEHRTWRARDYFVVTLGDTGAVTFFLNGKEIGTLGDEGAVIKNVVLSRARIRGD